MRDTSRLPQLAEPGGPVVSVIVPTFNSGRTISATLQSVAVQTYGNIEVIVVDGGSTDRTVAIAQGFGASVLQLGTGRSTSRRIGSARARGAYLLFLDSDQVADRNLVERALEVSTPNSRVALILPEIDAGEGLWFRCHSLLRHVAESGGLGYPRFFPSRLYRSIGGHTEGLEDYMEDRDLLLRLIDAGGSTLQIGAHITNLLGRVNPISMGIKGAQAARDADKYFLRNRERSETIWNVLRPRAVGMLRARLALVEDPAAALLAPVYVVTALGPRLVLAILARARLLLHGRGSKKAWPH